MMAMIARFLPSLGRPVQIFRRVLNWWRGPGTASSVRRCNRCGKVAVLMEWRTSEIGGSDRNYCDPCARNVWIPHRNFPVSVVNRIEGSGDVRVGIERILFGGQPQPLLILKEESGPRRLPLTIGHFEATAIWWALKREASPRPLTHESWIATAVALGAFVVSANVVLRRDDIYSSELRLARNGSILPIDVRPSDALAVAVRANVPILVAEPIMAADAVSEPEPLAS
jgi:bifunctional DNase/RNase